MVFSLANPPYNTTALVIIDREQSGQFSVFCTRSRGPTLYRNTVVSLGHSLQCLHIKDKKLRLELICVEKELVHLVFLFTFLHLSR